MGISMQKPFIRIGLVGLLVIATSLVLLVILPSKGPSMAQGFVTPVIAFEFAQSTQDILGIFGETDSPERQARVRAMDLGNQLDYLYMVLYAGFLALFSLKCTSLTGKRIFQIPAGLAMVALVADALENIQLFGITARLETLDFAPQLLALHWMTWAKWGSLALAFALLAPYFFKGEKYALTIGACGLVCLGLAILAFFAGAPFYEMLGAGTGVMFLLTIIYCFVHKESPLEGVQA